jgi:hypothetical protein
MDNKFYEITIHFPENLEMKKEDLRTLCDFLPLHHSEKYLIVDRLFINLGNSTHLPSCIAALNERVESIARRANLISILNFIILECDWIGELLELFDRDPYAHSLLKIANQDRNTCDEWTFDKLLVKLAIGEYQQYQQMEQKAIDALSKAPPPIVIIKDEAEIERLRIQYSPKEKL